MLALGATEDFGQIVKLRSVCMINIDQEDNMTTNKKIQQQCFYDLATPCRNIGINVLQAFYDQAASKAENVGIKAEVKIQDPVEHV